MNQITEAGDAEHLRAAFRGKCAWCEAPMAHVQSPQIEHYRPKSKFPGQMFRWENWLLSCGRCNEKKWKHFPYCGAAPCLLDPCNEDPYAHLHFTRNQILSVTWRGHCTVQLLGLDRTPMDRERAKWLFLIDALLLLAVSGSADARRTSRDFLIWSMQPDAPWSAMSYCYLRVKAPKLADPVVAHPTIQIEDPLAQLDALLSAHTAALSSLL